MPFSQFRMRSLQTLDDGACNRLNLDKDGCKCHQLPETGYLRLSQIIGDAKANPPIPAVIPISKSSWWAGVKSGKYPKSVKLGPRTTVWPVDAIRALIASAR